MSPRPVPYRPRRPRRVVVIGNGMVGARFAEEVRRLDPGGDRVRLTVVGEEPGPCNRVLLPGVLSGALRPEEVGMPRPEGPGTAVLGAHAAAVDRSGRRVLLADGRALGYDRLVLATGARPVVPPVAGLRAPDGGPGPGAAVLRGPDDCRRIARLARPGDPVAVLGGGPLGLETARALAVRGHPVTVVEAAHRIMPHRLDRAGGRLLAELLERRGVRVLSGRACTAWVPGRGLDLDDGTRVPARAVVVAVGVRASARLAEEAGIAVRGGVLVDDALATSDPLVHAIGDCAEHPGGGAGLVGPGWEQAAVLAGRLTGRTPDAAYRGARTVTRLKADGIEMVSVGEVGDGPGAQTAGDPPEEVTVSDPAGGRYARLLLRAGRVSGAVVVGLPGAAAAVTAAFDADAPVPPDRLGLLLGADLASADAGGGSGDGRAPVCRCNGVSRDRIEQAWLEGARDLAGMARATRATTGCGGCAGDVGALLDRWSKDTPEPARG
ncbi:FAD-dependent oxidoreductase [Nocardiopsis sp. RSe5-2]|uniref:FAD-dependent oxidoreductase n=1 Tax=Nocardiopsis endophytica TaxID=3018445 RepID=A0ABT4U394_9ACTN|nr:FAD-dependent oxidoreductase [Nocardiopsis endophytica]MDA2811405.1 FAD-dependent oxidoreductase [Nocardiopsis endophytica]